MKTRYASVEEQLSIILHIVGHDTKNMTMCIEFFRSGETISRYFNDVLQAVCGLHDDFVQPLNDTCHLEIGNDPNWYPFFKVNKNNNDNKF